MQRIEQTRPESSWGAHAIAMQTVYFNTDQNHKRRAQEIRDDVGLTLRECGKIPTGELSQEGERGESTGWLWFLLRGVTCEPAIDHCGPITMKSLSDVLYGCLAV